jgi:hypothetical protein
VPFSVVPTDFIQAAQRTDGRIGVYSTVDFLGTPERPEEEKGCDSPGVPWTEAQLRAWAAYQHAGGVTGLNLFNGHHQEHDWRALIAVFGQPYCWETAFVAGDKTFVANNQSFTANMPSVAWPALPRLPLPLTVGKTASIGINIPAVELNAPRATTTLRLKFGQLTVEDEILVQLNGEALGTLGKRNSAQEAMAVDAAKPLEEAIAERALPVPSAALHAGENLVQVTLVHRNPWLRPPLKWKNAELRFRNREGKG